MGNKGSKDRISELDQNAEEVTHVNTEETEPAIAEIPWRKMEEDFSWSKEYEEKLIDAVQKHDTCVAVKNVRLLFVGPLGAGKSSVINSVATIDKGRIAEVVRVGDEEQSVTTKLKVYRPSNRLENFRIIDTMGIEENEGFNIDDIDDLVMGKLKANYKFNTRSKGSETELRKAANQKHSVHCVVVVIDVNNIGQANNISEKTKGKIDTLRHRIKDREIPLIILLTKIDLLCDEVKCDVRNVFKSKKVEKAVKIAHELFKVPERNIYPVQSYSKETLTEPNMNILILLVLRQMLDFATDYLNELSMPTSSDEEEDE